jgi:hypothetical protein
MIERRPRRELVPLIAVAASSAFVALLTPVGPRLVMAPFEVSDITWFIEEWQRPNLRSAPGLAALALIAMFCLSWLRRAQTPGWPSLLVLGLSCGLVISYERTVPLAAAIAVPVTAAAIGGWRRRAHTPVARSERQATVVLAGVGLLVAAVLAPSVAGRPSGVPSGLDARLRALPQGTVICNEYSLGGWLLWRHPNVIPVIDPRAEIYDVAYIKTYLAFSNGGDAWRDLLQETRCSHALLDEDRAAANLLTQADGWSRLAQDGDTVLLRRGSTS